MRRNQERFNKGFTLVELLAALLISGILLTMIIAVFLMSQRIYTKGENISYKQKSITNIETDLQNALAVASETGVKIDTIPGGNYSIGFKNSVCVEVIGGETYENNQIDKIIFTVIDGNTMSYEIIPKDQTMSTQKGGIVMNNIRTAPFGSETFDEGTKYLVINYETGS